MKGESGGIGRRTGLRIQPWKQGGGSNPPSRTKRQDAEKLFFLRLLKKVQIQGARNSAE
jgi:hypothetical protein